MINEFSTGNILVIFLPSFLEKGMFLVECNALIYDVFGAQLEPWWILFANNNNSEKKYLLIYFLSFIFFQKLFKLFWLTKFTDRRSTQRVLYVLAN